MHLNKATRFALYAATELARAYPGRLTVQEIATAYHASEHHLAKVMQTLARHEVVAAERGVGGGYRLAASPKSITVLDIIRVFQPDELLSASSRRNGGEVDGGDRDPAQALLALLAEVDRQVTATFAAVSIDQLANGPGRIATGGGELP